MRELETSVLVLLRERSDGQSQPVQARLQQLRVNLSDARLDIRDAEYADTAVEYKRHVAEAQVRLARIMSLILELSQHNVFTAVEVAELGARLEVIGRAV